MREFARAALPAQTIAVSSSSSIATLPALVRGGAFLLLTPMFLSIGLPVEGIWILIAIDAIPDIFATVLNVTGDLAAAVFVAGRPKA